MTEETPLPVVPLYGPAARRLADLAGVFQDLHSVVDACERSASLLEQEQPDGDVVVRSLWTSSLVAYARCFASGKRLGLSLADVAELPGDGVGLHDYLMGMRNKHIAHSVNPFEQVQVGAVIGPDETGTFGVLSVATLTVVHVSATLEGVASVRLLALELAKRVSELARDLEVEALAEARAEDLDELQKRPAMRVTAPGPERATELRSAE